MLLKRPKFYQRLASRNLAIKNTNKVYHEESLLKNKAKENAKENWRKNFAYIPLTGIHLNHKAIESPLRQESYLAEMILQYRDRK